MHLIVKEKFISPIEAEQKIVRLQEKLTHDHELDITGILNLSSMNLTDNDLPLIIHRIFYSEQKKCTGLILRGNNLSSVGVKMLVDDLLLTRTNIQCLCLSNNSDVGDTGIEQVIRLLQRNRSLNLLALPNTGITDHAVRLLADTLCRVNTNLSCSPLGKLDISFNKSITDESVEALVQIMKQNQTLKVLSLQYCSLSEKAREQLRQISSKKKKKKIRLSV